MTDPAAPFGAYPGDPDVNDAFIPDDAIAPHVSCAQGWGDDPLGTGGRFLACTGLIGLVVAVIHGLAR